MPVMEKIKWYSCGQIDLPDWAEVQVGVHAETPVDLYPIVKRAETWFSDLYFEGQCLSSGIIQ